MNNTLRYILFCLMFVSIQVVSQTTDTLFEQANTNYQNGKFKQAISTYDNILKQGVHSADLYYNLGNAYYKINEVAPSIYYYEKALLLNPNHQDAHNNLALAQRSTIDVIEPLPKTLFQRINERLIYPISYNTWAWLAVVFAFISSTLFILYYFSRYSHIKRRYFIFSFISLGLFLMLLSIGIKAKHHYNNNQPAIVFAKEVNVNDEPMTSANESFTLHEGTKVVVKNTNNDWYKIEIANGKSGWLQKDEVRLLK